MTIAMGRPRQRQLTIELYLSTKIYHASAMFFHAQIQSAYYMLRTPCLVDCKTISLWPIRILNIEVMAVAAVLCPRLSPGSFP